MNVAVLGASPEQERYSNKAVRQLLAKGHTVFPIHPSADVIEGLRVYRTLADVPEKLHTITVYVGPVHIKSVIPTIVAARPERVIVNPGAESPLLKAAVMAAQISYVEACTLVMLSTGQF